MFAMATIWRRNPSSVGSDSERCHEAAALRELLA